MKTGTRCNIQYKVFKVEFDMGKNDQTDIHAGGPATLSFWVSTNLPRRLINKVAKSEEIQSAVKAHGGSGCFTVSKTWADSFIKTESELRKRLLYWINRSF